MKMFPNMMMLLIGSLLAAGAFSNTTPVSYEHCPSYGDIVFVLDSSGSIDNSEFALMEAFVENVIQRLGEGDNARFGLVEYDSSVWTEFDLNDHSTVAGVLATFSTLTRRSSGGTNTHLGLFEARSLFDSSRGDRDRNTNIIIILTDGHSSSQSSTLAEAALTKGQGIRIISIGVGSGFDQVEIEGMASEPINETVFTVLDFNGLIDILTDVCRAVEDIEDKDPDSPRGGHGHDCTNNNPCAPTVKTAGLYYYTHSDKHMFVQCSAHGQCYEMTCPALTEWSETALTCIHEQDDSQESGGGYNCGDNNPCAPALRVAYRYYYEHTLNTMFVQCSQWGQCYEMPCPPGLVWNPTYLTCA